MDFNGIELIHKLTHSVP